MVKFGDLTMLQNVFNWKCQNNMSIAIRAFCAFLSLWIFGGNYQARAANNDTTNKSRQVDKLFNCTVKADIPGASVIVIQNGKILHKKGYGFANIELNMRNNPETIFRLGSVTKQFTAMGILQLHEKGLLDIDDSVGKYFTGTLHGDKIKIRHLLTHTSGITESLDSPLEFTPGEQLSYSNSGYNLLGRIIEKISGDSYDEYLRKNIFQPLKMFNTGFEHPNINLENRATGYEISENGKYSDLGNSDVSGAYAAGALYSTAEDMYLWDQALYTEKIVKSETIRQAFSPAKLNDGSVAKYGFGWILGQYHGLREIGHGGDITGFNSYIARFPDEHFTVIVLSNVAMRPSGPLPHAGDLAHKIAGIYLADKMEAKAENMEIKLDPEIYDAYVGRYKLVNAPPEVVEVSGDSFTITRENKCLYLQSKLGKVVIHPETETLFFVKADNTKILFVREESEEVTGMTVDLMGIGLRVINAEKLNSNFQN
jgi:CubicO group peptidase (beta-lactamase class C family)